jgi:AcrR family transcriptional regulator
MAQANKAPKAAGRRARSKPGVKREEILRVAIEAFGREGYEDAKWADVASAVGIGPTALYHYFESKLHCLYVIMADTLQANLEQFEAVTRDATDYPAALQTVLRAGFDVTEQQVLCNRVLVAEQARPRPHPRHGIRVGNLPGASDGAGRHPGSRPEAAHARSSRLAQQRLALVPGRWRPEPR